MFESRISKVKKLEKAKDYFKNAVTYDHEWQREAYEDFKFRDGIQWTDEEKQLLADELRPCLTFNLTKSSVDLIMGMNEESKLKYRATPTEPSDGFLADVLNDLVDWLYEQDSLEHEEDNALESAVICGRGYVAVDFVPDPNRFGEIKLQLVDVPVHEIHFDPAARRINLEDASYICWDRWLSEEDFRIKFPKVSNKKVEELLEIADNGGEGTLPDGTPASAFTEIVPEPENTDYDKIADVDFYDKNKRMIRIVHMEYWKAYKRYYAAHPKTGAFFEFDERDLKMVKENHMQEFGYPLNYEVLYDKKVHWLQFTGDEILYDDESPLPYPGFSICPVIAYRDVSGRTANHFGIVRLMKDPQKEINKRWSQALNLLNQQVQTGVFAETDAFVDQRQAQASLKEPGSITWVNAGAIAGAKFRERQVPTFPNAPMQMEEFSQEMMKKVTGINPDLLGQDRGRQEPGVVVRLRQQQGMTLLKPLFKNFNKMKKDIFQRVLAIITSYMPDQQMLRILGEGDRYQIVEGGQIMDQATEMVADIRNVRDLAYNVKGEESSGSLTKRAMELAAMMEMAQSGAVPVDPLLLVEKLNLSEREKAKWIQYIQSQQQAMQEQQDQMMQAELQFKDREIRVDEQKNAQEFVVDMMKIEQMSDKDKMRLFTELISMEQEQQANIANHVAQMTQILASVEQAKAQAKAKGGKKDGEA